ncbi:integrase catalytic domain-containing protein [Trichonephila clavipes]|nr:integrase catalytic domain-containing protein [Trichonephila clavipes]
MPCLDENRLIRLGGRLESCNLSIDEKHPLILPKNSWLTTLLVRREYNKAIGMEEHSVHWYQKYLAKPIDQLTSPLPSDRINQTPAFSVCGLDFVGPLYVSNFGELQKSYYVLFTCRVTRAHFTWNWCLI